jgi:hypothetical protein
MTLMGERLFGQTGAGNRNIEAAGTIFDDYLRNKPWAQRNKSFVSCSCII